VSWLDRIAQVEDEKRQNIDNTVLFFSTVRAEILSQALVKHIEPLLKERKLGHPAAEVSRWNKGYFHLLAINTRHHAATMHRLIPGLENDPEKLAEQALVTLADWPNHIDTARQPESVEAFRTLSMYWQANPTQFSQELRAVFNQLVRVKAP
jgi:hypothetical protein